mmetsp:Transcript_25682/g.64808  ORF Transcript_25682/g.64808 Transcript_25682/m.64808 type:complete len:156 (-) Transcript_25682:179-646(-)
MIGELRGRAHSTGGSKSFAAESINGAMSGSALNEAAVSLTEPRTRTKMPRTLLLVLFSLGCVAITTTVVYTLLTDGTPFRPELLTPWMTATLVDIYIAFLCCYAWIFYKERSWLARGLWLLAVLSTGSIAITAYVVLQLLRLPPGSSVERLLLRN